MDFIKQGLHLRQLHPSSFKKFYRKRLLLKPSRYFLIIYNLKEMKKADKICQCLHKNANASGIKSVTWEHLLSIIAHMMEF